jgi:hypothetical protein
VSGWQCPAAPAEIVNRRKPANDLDKNSPLGFHQVHVVGTFSKIDPHTTSSAIFVPTIMLIVTVKKAVLIAVFALAIFGTGVIWLSRGIVLCSFLYGIPSGADAEEAHALVGYLDDHFVFPEKSKVAPKQSPVFCSPGSGGGIIFGPVPHHIFVYTITDKQHQDEILDLLRHYQKEKELRPIVVDFYRAENWVVCVSPNGWTNGGHREQEELIRSEKLK